jgi:hypothetical protein
MANQQPFYYPSPYSGYAMQPAHPYQPYGPGPDPRYYPLQELSAPNQPYMPPVPQPQPVANTEPAKTKEVQKKEQPKKAVPAPKYHYGKARNSQRKKLCFAFLALACVAGGLIFALIHFLSPGPTKSPQSTPGRFLPLYLSLAWVFNLLTAYLVNSDTSENNGMNTATGTNPTTSPSPIPGANPVTGASPSTGANPGSAVRVGGK